MRKTLLTAGSWCGFLAALTNLLAFTWYVYEVFGGKVDTNPVTWYLWLIETAVSLTLFRDRTHDMSKWLAEGVSMVGVLLVAVYLTGKVIGGQAAIVLASVQPSDVIPTLIAGAAFLVWTQTKDNPRYTGLALWVFQIALFAAVVPLIRATYAHPSVEPLGPWAMWTGAFTLQSICVILKLKKGEIDTLLSPINYAITHGAIALIIWQGAAIS